MVTVQHSYETETSSAPCYTVGHFQLMPQEHIAATAAAVAVAAVSADGAGAVALAKHTVKPRQVHKGHSETHVTSWQLVLVGKLLLESQDAKQAAQSMLLQTAHHQILPPLLPCWLLHKPQLQPRNHRVLLLLLLQGGQLM
jgi:hypothetical protein